MPFLVFSQIFPPSGISVSHQTVNLSGTQTETVISPCKYARFLRICTQTPSSFISVFVERDRFTQNGTSQLKRDRSLPLLHTRAPSRGSPTQRKSRESGMNRQEMTDLLPLAGSDGGFICGIVLSFTTRELGCRKKKKNRKEKQGQQKYCVGPETTFRHVYMCTSELERCRWSSLM